MGGGGARGGRGESLLTLYNISLYLYWWIDF